MSLDGTYNQALTYLAIKKRADTLREQPNNLSVWPDDRPKLIADGWTAFELQPRHYDELSMIGIICLKPEILEFLEGVTGNFVLDSERYVPSQKDYIYLRDPHEAVEFRLKFS
jgi:hypothetical protein